MIKISDLFFLFAMTLFICQEGFCQMKFEAKLIFPQSLTKDKIEISIDNGKKSKDITFELHDNQVVLSDTFYSPDGSDGIQSGRAGNTGPGELCHHRPEAGRFFPRKRR